MIVIQRPCGQNTTVQKLLGYKSIQPTLNITFNGWNKNINNKHTNYLSRINTVVEVQVHFI